MFSYIVRSHVPGGGFQNKGGGVTKLNREKGKSSGSIASMGKQQPPVLLKLFISGNERCHTTDAP